MRKMKTRSRALPRAIILLALVVPGSVLAVDFSCAIPANSGEKGMLDGARDALTSVQGTPSNVKDMQAWLGLLVGQYTVEGYVDLCGKGNAKDLRPVTGMADCIAARSPLSVHCKVNVNWPAARRTDGTPVLGGVSNLAPAQILLSIARNGPSFKRGQGPDDWSLLLLQADSTGVAEWASSELWGDTFMSRERCVDKSRSCYKITRITARPDSYEVSMQVGIEINRDQVLRQKFLLRRVKHPEE